MSEKTPPVPGEPWTPKRTLRSNAWEPPPEPRKRKRHGEAPLVKMEHDRTTDPYRDTSIYKKSGE